MNFLSVLYAKAGITVDGTTTLNGTSTALTPTTSDNSTKIATTAFVKNQNYYPYPTGTTAQYVRGDGSLATFPSVASEAQRLITEVYNETGATLTKGTVVYINGGHGNLPTVTKAIATGDATSAQTYGVVQSDITNNNNGFVVVNGSLADVNTFGLTAGQALYLSSTTAGEWTTTKQYAPAHLVYVATVVRAHPTQGVVEVRIQNGYEMDELHNVSAQNPSNGDILQYVSSTGLWTKVAGTTSAISEGSNLYYTNTRARAAISETVTGLDYNSTTGVLSTTSGYGIPTTAKQTTWDTAYNDSIVSAAVTGTSTKTLTLNQQDGGTVTASWTDINTDAVSSVFGRTGAVVAASGDYTTTQVTEGTNLYYTEARVDANTNVAANTAARHNAVTLGTANGLSLSTQQLSLGLASSSATGALSSTDWTTFNNKQNALTNPITGTGTTNYLPKFTGSTTLGNSIVYDNGTNVGIGTTSPYTIFEIKAIDPVQRFSVSGGVTNNKTYEIRAIGASGYEGLQFRAVNDANSVYDSLMFLARGGNVGIGTSSPASKLHINTSTNENVSIGSLSSIPTGRTLILQTSSLGGSIETYSSLTSGYVPLLLNPNGGNVGIGTTSPLDFSGFKTLTINGTSGSIFYTQVNGVSAGFMSGESSFTIVGETRNKPLWFAVNSSISGGFFGNGNFAIGTTTDAGYKLDVNGTARVSGMTTIVSGIGTGLNFKFSSGYGNSIIGLNYDSGADSGNSMYFGVNNAAGSPVTALTLYGTGAATFSSTLNAKAGSYINGAANSDWGFTVENTGTTSAHGLYVNIGSSSTGIPFRVDKGGSALFNIANSGIATFNSGTANQNTKISGSQISMSRTSDGAEVVYLSKNTDLGTEGTANIQGYNGIQFRTQGSETVKATITSGGNVLIGTTTDAGYKLDVNGTARVSGTRSTPLLYVHGGGDSSGGGKGNIRTGDLGAGNYYDFGRDNLITGDFVITYNNSSPLLSIASTGAATFSSSVTAQGLLNNSYSIGTSSFGIDSVGSTKVANGLLFRFGAISSVTNGFTASLNASNNGINYSFDYGNVGIGTTSPIHTLSVVGKIGGNIFGDSYVEFLSTGNTIVKANNDVIFGYSQNVIVKQGGNVLIGTATDNGTKLQVSGNASISGSITFASDYGLNQFVNGTGDGSSFSTYNFALVGWSSMAFYNPTVGGTYPNQVSGLVDFREGVINMKGGFKVNGSTVLYAGNYSSYALPIAGGTITGDLTVNNKVYVGTHGCYFQEVLIGGVYELQVVDSAGNMTVIS